MTFLEKVKHGNRCCGTVGKCKQCPYTNEDHCFEKLIEDIETLIDLVELDAHPWIPVEVETPVDDDKYMVCLQTKSGRRSINMAWFDGTFWHCAGITAGVTHWKPLPSLPEVTE